MIPNANICLKYVVLQYDIFEVIWIRAQGPTRRAEVANMQNVGDANPIQMESIEYAESKDVEI